MFRTVGTKKYSKKYSNNYKVKSVKNEKVPINDKIVISELKLEFKLLKKYINKNNEFLEQEIRRVKNDNKVRLAEFERKMDECGSDLDILDFGLDGVDFG